MNQHKHLQNCQKQRHISHLRDEDFGGISSKNTKNKYLQTNSAMDIANLFYNHMHWTTV